MTDFTEFPIPTQVVDIQETPKAAALPRARPGAPHLARGWVDPVAACPPGSVISIPDYLPTPDGWWDFGAAAEGLRTICNWTPEALRTGSTDARDLTFDPKGLFTDAAGLIPVADPGATIAAHRDSQGRLLATQATSAARPTYGRHPASGLRNIFSANTADLTSGWTGVRSTVASASTNAGEPAFDVTTTESSVNGAYRAGATLNLVAGTYTISVVAKGTGFLVLRPTLATNFSDAMHAWFNLSTGQVGNASLAGGASIFTGAVTSAITPVGEGAYRCTATFTLGATDDIGPRLYLADSNGSLTVTEGATARFEAPQLERAGAVTAYQRRVSEFDITETGQRDVYYLAPDGVDDWMALASAFAPAGAYTVAAAHDHPDSVSNIIIGRASSGTNARLIRSSNNALVFRARGTTNRTDFSSGEFSAVSTGRAVALVRVANAGVADGWMSAIGPLSGSLTGDMVPMQEGGLDALFRGHVDYGIGRFYGGALIDRAITETERQMLQLYLASKGGITL